MHCLSEIGRDFMYFLLRLTWYCENANFCYALQVMFYKALKGLTDYGMKKWIPNANYQINSTLEGLVLGGVAGGMGSGYCLSLVW